MASYWKAIAGDPPARGMPCLQDIIRGVDMRLNTGKICYFSLAALVLFAISTLAASHQQLNGTWILDPTRSEFAGEPAIQTGAVTI